MTFKQWWKNYRIDPNSISLDNLNNIQERIAKDAWGACSDQYCEEILKIANKNKEK